MKVQPARVASCPVPMPVICAIRQATRFAHTLSFEYKDKRVMEQVSTNRSHGGVQGVYTHQSTVTGTAMTFSVFVPEHEAGMKLPVLWYLSGLTCTHANVTEKGEFREACAGQGVIFIAPDTSPRGDDVPDDEGYDFGKGAGFYVNATQAPWSGHYHMRRYIEDDLTGPH